MSYLILEPKYDGIRFACHRQGSTVKIFTEDKFRDRSYILPEVVKEIKSFKIDKFIIDVEAVVYKDDKPLPRESMMHLVVGKEAFQGEIKLFTHDCLYYGEEGPINLRGYAERLDYLYKLIPKTAKYIVPTVFYEARNRKELTSALEKCYKFEGSEGSMLKSSDSIYDISKPRTPEWAKIKKVHKISAEIIGLQRKALPFSSINMKTPTSNIEGEEALSTYKKLTEKSSTFIARCALRDGNKLFPLDSKKRLADSDFKIRWNANLSKPKWQGLDDKRLWKMNKQLEDRKHSDQAFGNTYAFSFKDKEPKLGDIISVVPVQLVEFTKDDNKYLAWMFPKVISPEPEKQKADDIKDIQPMIRKE